MIKKEFKEFYFNELTGDWEGDTLEFRKLISYYECAVMEIETKLRVICSFPEDVYLVKKCILAQDDIRLIKEKDYIMMAMDFWASLEHKIRYKKGMDMQVREEIAGSLQNAADTCYELDRNMELIRNRIQENH